MTEKRTITVAHSPDADDAFMFYALAREKIDTGDLRFEHTLRDIQSLNIEATRGTFDVTAISFGMYPNIAERYALLACGSSIGDGYGPVLVSREPIDPSEIASHIVAVPGYNTSAFVSLRLFAPDVKDIVMDFNEIQNAVVQGRVPAGLLIHEGQLTYASEGLRKVVDLGEWWKTETGLPLPMGGNAIRRDLGEELMREVSRLLRESIRYAFDHRDDALDYALEFSRGLDRTTADEFVAMWVNDLTIDYGERGRESVRVFLDRAHSAGLVPAVEKYDFY